MLKLKREKAVFVVSMLLYGAVLADVLRLAIS